MKLLIAALFLVASASAMIKPMPYNDYLQWKAYKVHDTSYEAWRLLGFYTDCNSGILSSDACSRYMLIETYVQPHNPNEAMKPQYFDFSNGTLAECQGDSCFPLDCHHEDTNFMPLSFFQIDIGTSDWISTLVDYQGKCLWTDEQYEFMQGNKNKLPQGCEATGYNIDGVDVYVATMASPNGAGDIELGLFNDYTCREYLNAADPAMAKLVLGCYFAGANDCKEDDGATYYAEYKSYITKFNQALDVFKFCQPAMAVNQLWNTDLNNQARDCGDDDENEDCFTCAAGESVNQCETFCGLGTMATIPFTDIQDASAQNGMMEVKVGNAVYGNNGRLGQLDESGNNIYLALFSSAIFVGGSIFFARAMKLKKKVGSPSLNSALMEPYDGTVRDGVMA